MSDSFYVPLGDGVFRSTAWTTGPWGPDAQHAGPPSALLGRAIEGAAPAGAHIARVTSEILRPVPIEDVKVEARVRRPGRSVALLEATLTAGAVEVMRASGWAIGTTDVDLPADAAPRAEPQRPPDALPNLFEDRAETDYIAAMEWRFVSGSFFELGPATAWLRMKLPLVQDEEPTPLQRVLTAADSSSGISGALDFSQWVYVNPDLTVHLHRALEGQWVCLDAVTTPERNGVGLTAAALYDRRGPVGRSAQSLFVARR
ncbi:MAG TPA: thioesterase family protein [Actinomycetota bacterium]|nr:thioesterase family protein [Actinomycetota bacterium]